MQGDILPVSADRQETELQALDASTETQLHGTRIQTARLLQLLYRAPLYMRVVIFQLRRAVQSLFSSA